MVLQGVGDDNGVSPVIAALLILALTIFLVAIFVVAILPTGNVDPTPIAGITISDNNGVITLTHFSGDTLPAGEYAILVNGVDQTQEFQAENVDFSPGTKLTWDLGITHPLHQVSVIYTGTGGSIVIAEKQFYREGGVEVNAAFTAVITEGKNATSQVKTGVSGPKPLPSVIADQADIWAVLDSVSNQAKVEFTAEESSADMAYSWTSGNGQTADINPAVFTYGAAGSYTVRLDIRNTTSGDTGTGSMILAVRDPGLTAMTWVKRNSDIYGTIVARTTTGTTGLNSAEGGWAINFNSYPKIEFKAIFTGSTSQFQARSRVDMVLGTWYHAAGVVDQSGTNAAETLRIYVNGVYPTTILNEGDPTGMTYFKPVKTSKINLNPSFNVSSYSEVPFPLSDAEIASIYAAEIGDPR